MSVGKKYFRKTQILLKILGDKNVISELKQEFNFLGKVKWWLVALICYLEPRLTIYDNVITIRMVRQNKDIFDVIIWV